MGMFKSLRKNRLPLFSKIKVTFSQKFFQSHLAILNFHFLTLDEGSEADYDHLSRPLKL